MVRISMPPTRWPVGVALALFGLLVPLLIAEALTRSFLDPSVNTFVYDALTGFMRPAGVKGQYSMEEFSTPAEFNSLGLNDREWGTGWNDAAACKILFLGDSMVEALQVPRSDNFVEQLNRRHSPTLRVMNGGVSSFGTVQEFLLGDKLLKKYDFDLVLLFFLSSNDVRNNLPDLEEGGVPAERRVRPYLVEMPGGWVLQGPATEELSSIAQPSLLKAILHKSRLYSLVRTRVLRAGLRFPSSDDASASGDDFPVELGIYSSKPDEIQERGWRVSNEALSRLSAAVRKHGAALVVGAMPGPEQIDGERWLKLLAAYPAFRATNPSPLIPVDRIRQFAAGLDAPFLDLVRGMRAVPHPAELFFPLDGHLTAAGHSAVADYLSARLTELCAENVPVRQGAAASPVGSKF